MPNSPLSVVITRTEINNLLNLHKELLNLDDIGSRPCLNDLLAESYAAVFTEIAILVRKNPRKRQFTLNPLPAELLTNLRKRLTICFTASGVTVLQHYICAPQPPYLPETAIPFRQWFVGDICVQELQVDTTSARFDTLMVVNARHSTYLKDVYHFPLLPQVDPLLNTKRLTSLLQQACVQEPIRIEACLEPVLNRLTSLTNFLTSIFSVLHAQGFQCLKLDSSGDPPVVSTPRGSALPHPLDFEHNRLEWAFLFPTITASPAQCQVYLNLPVNFFYAKNPEIHLSLQSCTVDDLEPQRHLSYLKITPDEEGLNTALHHIFGYWQQLQAQSLSC